MEYPGRCYYDEDTKEWNEGKDSKLQVPFTLTKLQLSQGKVKQFLTLGTC